MAQANAITNPNNLIDVSLLNYFEGKLGAKYQTQSITAITGMTATTVEGALSELLGKINGLPSAIVPKGTKTFSQLAPSTDLVAANVGFMWNISDSFTTTENFVEGAGKLIPAGANVYVANPETNVYKYDVFQGMVDLSNYKTKQNAVSDPSADGTGLTFIDSISQNENGVITPHKKTVADVVASTSGAGGSSGLMTAYHAEKLNALPTRTELTAEEELKADKLGSAFDASKAYAKDDIVIYNSKVYKFTTAHAAGSWTGEDAVEITDNFFSIGADGNLKDSGHKHSDYQAAGSYKTVQTAVVDPTKGSSPALEFIATITQNTNGEITVTKQGVKVASTSDIDEIFA